MGCLVFLYYFHLVPSDITEDTFMALALICIIFLSFFKTAVIILITFIKRSSDWIDVKVFKIIAKNNMKSRNKKKNVVNKQLSFAKNSLIVQIKNTSKTPFLDKCIKKSPSIKRQKIRKFSTNNPTYKTPPLVQNPIPNTITSSKTISEVSFKPKSILKDLTSTKTLSSPPKPYHRRVKFLDPSNPL
uniref:Uncharacterized protein n=1 Tax=Euplotes crassus TaxID=5936 RepID=A0A7S3P3L1_EUPCR|mmetsp:Transcript_9248/g.8899  ORF Transcript_9248/g.8899 Transcript_9248/m.8899 type:complete len:187 (+) Transcript_9248:1044-1604(+)